MWYSRTRAFYSAFVKKIFQLWKRRRNMNSNEILSFSDMDIAESLLRAVEEMGFEEPTTIQSQCIPLIAQGFDVLGQSQTGTGKTAAFAIPTLQNTNPNDRSVQVLVLCPTRELCIQASEEYRKFGKYLHGVKTAPIYGGQDIDRQIRALKQGVQIVIGTPGRIMDHMRRRTLKLGGIKTIVLDEADEMLNMGFREDMETILKDTPQERQTLLFSATMSKEILEIARNFQKDPKSVRVEHKELTVPSIEQYYLEISRNSKVEMLSRLVDVYDPKLTIVFCNRKSMVDEVADQLQTRGYMAEALHGDIRQNARTSIMQSFRSGRTEILVATDVAARGIDIDDVEMIINFDIPQDEEYYVHRIGRTARAGRSGKAFTFVTGKKQLYALRDIQKYTKSKILPHAIPSIKDMRERRINRLVGEVKEVLELKAFDEYTEVVDRLMKEDYASVDIAAALAQMLLKTEQPAEENPTEEIFDDSSAEPGMTRLFINVGRKDNAKPGDIVGAIAGETGLKGKLIGSIDVHEMYTFVEVPKAHARDVIRLMRNVRIKGRAVNIEPANARRGRES
jgi:ATP-dependent RNA helicase DeaD